MESMSLPFVARLKRALGAVAQFLRVQRREPVRYDWFTRDEIASYSRLRMPRPESPVDEQTWRDLQLDAYMRLVGERLSILGRQLLYDRLRCGSRTMLNEATTHILDLAQLPSAAKAISESRATCDALRQVAIDPAAELFGEHALMLPGWVRWLRFLPLLGIFGGALLLAGVSGFGWACVGLYAVGAPTMTLALSPTLRRWNPLRRAITQMLFAAQALGQVAKHHEIPLAVTGKELQAEVAALVKVFNLTLVERTPGLADYANLFLLYEYAKVSRLIRKYGEHLESLRRVYCAVADGELTYAMVTHLMGRRTRLTKVSYVENDGLIFRGVVNPLVAPAAEITIETDADRRGVFITGANGVGKSTLLRAIGLNVVVGRAFGFCYAELARLPSFRVLSSLQNEDSLERGESLHMAELRRAKELLQLSQSAPGAIVLFDEICRGTNNLESTAAAGSLIQHLAKTALLIVSSHDIVLGQLMRRVLEPKRLEQVASVHGALRLLPGFAVQTNGLALLNSYQFPKEIVEAAEHIRQSLVEFELNSANFDRIDESIPVAPGQRDEVRA